MDKETESMMASNYEMDANFCNTTSSCLKNDISSKSLPHNCIKDRSQLRLLIGSWIMHIKYLDEVGDTEASEELAKNVATVSQQMLQPGIVTDPLSGQKYFVSTGRLDGGGPSYSTARQVESHNPRNLCLKGTNAYERVSKELQLLSNARNCNRMTHVIIKNQSQYPLVYKNHGTYSGYFFSDAQAAFQYENSTICAQDGVGGFLVTKTSGTACGASGYISFTVPTEGKNYIVCCGFDTGYSSTSGAGIEIRGEDGVTDEMGRITGHGIDPAGNVTDICALVTKTHHSTHNSRFHEFHETCRAFKVYCCFTNESWGEFIFSVRPK